MHNYPAILKRVGIVSIAIGIFDLAYFIHYTSQDISSSSNWRQSYSSHGLLLVAAGVFLLRGSLRAVPTITWFAAFGISNLVSSIFTMLLFFKPAELWAIEFRLDPVGFSRSFLVKIISIGLLYWIYKQLRAAPVLSASLKSGHSTSTPKFAFILGIASAVLLTGIMHFTQNSAAGAKAVELARSQYGNNYKYYLTAISWTNGNVKAWLTAYNQHEIKPVQVEWK
ncbi:hypothetical protein IQ270_21965 [Microcoleus sp. LEGE 07076]|uniref:hypothetical protein n=1 Tax=Microcoleus sp. LEGE 07076 TaxID=915322 RepID=UPI00188288EC|nr:hypothetical protein [Microcoleus sp. LEGE 07076]MBE9187244.1 hypothetical protein [Microcoleus sp. LEGE 07076]